MWIVLKDKQSCPPSNNMIPLVGITLPMLAVLVHSSGG